MSHDHIKGAIALGISIGKKESTDQIEALATEIATGTYTTETEARLAMLGQGIEGIELISAAIKEAVYDRASDGHYKNLCRLNELVKSGKPQNSGRIVR